MEKHELKEQENQEKQIEEDVKQIMFSNRCVSCGEIIPEGRQICTKCERFLNK